MLTDTPGTPSEQADMKSNPMITDLRRMKYEEGTILTLRVHDMENHLVTVRILKLYRPFSFSCAMKVEILHGLSKFDKVPQRAVLKLYDRRYAMRLRSEHNVGPWTSDVEESFVEFVRSNPATRFHRLFREPELVEEPESSWSQAENETYLQGWCSDTLAVELETYRQLEELQGKQVPRVFSAVTVLSRSATPGTSDTSKNPSSLLQIQGILMEHINGPTFIQMPDFIQPRKWQQLVDEALRVVDSMSKLGVIDEGLSISNIVACPQGGQDDQYRVVFLDFAQCNIRQTGQSDQDWEKLKMEQDQEGIIMSRMSAILKRVGFELQFPSKDYEKRGIGNG